MSNIPVIEGEGDILGLQNKASIKTSIGDWGHKHVSFHPEVKDVLFKDG